MIRFAQLTSDDDREPGNSKAEASLMDEASLKY
jgi:hypothetical protein